MTFHSTVFKEKKKNVSDLGFPVQPIHFVTVKVCCIRVCWMFLLYLISFVTDAEARQQLLVTQITGEAVLECP